MNKIDQQEASGFATDSLDPRKMLLPQNFGELVAVRKNIVSVPIRKPHSQMWFFPNPDIRWRFPVGILERKERNEIYVVAPSMLEALAGEWSPRQLVFCKTRQESIFLWHFKLPGSDGRLDSWNESAGVILSKYAGQWIRLRPNQELGAYDVDTPVSSFPDPKWDDDPDSLLTIAFKGCIIDSIDHPVVKELRGEI